jgi:phosphohistidine phosphatase
MKSDCKTLYLVRHAKAVKTVGASGDIDRPLHEAGYEEAYRIASGLFATGDVPELIVSSPAVRAISTALIFQRSLHVPDSRIQIMERIYEASLDDIYEIVAGLDDRYRSVMLVGHNPSFTMLAAKMDTGISHIPTAGVARFDFEAEKWRHSSYINADLKLFRYP